MAPRIYNSPYPSVPIPECSIFTFLLDLSPDKSLIGGHPKDFIAVQDAETGTTVSRERLRDVSLSFAYGLQKLTNLSRGDTVLFYSPNSLLWPVLFFGCMAAGLKCTFANPAYTRDELAFQYSETNPSLVLTADDTLPIVLDMFKSLGQDAASKTVVLGKSLKWAGGPDAPLPSHVPKGFMKFEDFIFLGQLSSEEKFNGKELDEIALLCFSSGTSGKPKGVMTTHRNLVSVVSIQPSVFPTLQPQENMYAILPFYHIFGAVNLLQLPLLLGVYVVIAPRFDPESFCRHVEKYRIPFSMVVPPILVVLAHHPVVSKYDLSSLKYVISGAAPLGPALVEQVRSRLGNTLAITQGYGLTETSPTCHVLTVQESTRKLGSIGKLLPNLEARLVLEGDGNEDAAVGEPGELWVRGPTIMKGYLNRPDATAEVITRDGFFKTGDVAIYDREGFFYIVDRLKELIKYKGFQVPPAELEGVLLGHPAIVDVAVIGVDSPEEATELPRAYVVHAKPETVKTKEQQEAFGKHVATWMQNKVANFKHLRGGVILIPVIPKSPSGKILRRELRELAKQEQQLKAKL